MTRRHRLASNAVMARPLAIAKPVAIRASPGIVTERMVVGLGGTRTSDLFVINEALNRLSYRPVLAYGRATGYKAGARLSKHWSRSASVTSDAADPDR